MKLSCKTIVSSASKKKPIIGNILEVSIANLYNFVSQSKISLKIQASDRRPITYISIPLCQKLMIKMQRCLKETQSISIS